MSYKHREKKKKVPELTFHIVEVMPSKIPESVECPKCEGDGQQLWKHGGFDICGECNGSGKVIVTHDKTDKRSD